ncbi:MAG: polyribonucleotide nucleotidyltransferase [Candidatus Marinimicrobia bacterium]|nr:polyribonucleotide nucleotidyltransferase [Candidatus Neomarinimicrobiota bacterium]
MSEPTKTVVEIAGKEIHFETGELARQAAGACTIRLGDTVLFSAVTVSKQAREGVDFLPLQVEYREKFYAAGRFPGGYFKREARPSEKEILTMRATDRPIRPLFPEGFHNELQINNLLLSADGENDPDILSINAASAALTLSEIPFLGPIGAVRIGRINGEWVVNPTHGELVQSDLNLTYVGTRELPVMIEGTGQEVPEDDLVSAMEFAQKFVTQLVDAQIELRRAAGLPEKVVVLPEVDSALEALLSEAAGDELSAALLIAGKLERQEAVSAVREKLLAAATAARPELTEDAFARAFDAVEIKTVRCNVLEHGKRIDGRAFDELRALSAKVGFLPCTHGSALFSRGETQALATCTLGTKSDSQSMDAVTGGANEKSFMLHYNFPPYCTGETGRLGMTSRREIGHGNLAERSLRPMMPEDFPYTIRLVSEVMGSNGSSSMASICVGTLALMDAGVPMKKPVAGISIGMFSEGDRSAVITDILGSEDHCGDMDFKVAGTREGVTGFQVDLKITGLAWEQVRQAFHQARAARLKILDYMASVLPAPRPELSPRAPRLHVMRIDPDKIGALIGPGGKNIRRITETTGAQIDIEDDGQVMIYARDAAMPEAAIQEVGAVTAEVEVDKIYRGRVTGVKEFGAFVEVLPGKDGLVHISQLADYRVNAVEDIAKVGDMMWVKCIGVDDRGKVRLSRREALADRQAAGEKDD